MTDDAERCRKEGEEKIGSGDYSGAIQSLKKALELNPKIAGVYTDLGIASDSSGDVDSAIEYFKKEVELVPCPPSYDNLGKATRKKYGDNAAAKVYEDAYNELTRRGCVFTVPTEYNIFYGMSCECGKRYTRKDFKGQSLIEDSVTKKQYDVFKIKCSVCSRERELKFRVRT